MYKVTLQPLNTSNYFAPGHRLRIEVSSSNFPRFDRNLNTGGNNYDETKGVVAHNVVHHSSAVSVVGHAHRRAKAAAVDSPRRVGIYDLNCNFGIDSKQTYPPLPSSFFVPSHQSRSCPSWRSVRRHFSGSTTHHG